MAPYERGNRCDNGNRSIITLAETCTVMENRFQSRNCHGNGTVSETFKVALTDMVIWDDHAGNVCGVRNRNGAPAISQNGEVTKSGIGAGVR